MLFKSLPGKKQDFLFQSNNQNDECCEKIYLFLIGSKTGFYIFDIIEKARSLYSMVKESSDMTKRVPTREKNRFFSVIFIFPSDMNIFQFSIFLSIPLTSIDSD